MTIADIPWLIGPGMCAMAIGGMVVYASSIQVCVVYASSIQVWVVYASSIQVCEVYASNIQVFLTPLAVYDTEIQCVTRHVT
jgi:hypothetical protein